MDFTSAHYLGLRHSSVSLGPWTQLSTGQPAALREIPAAQRVAGRLAALQGLEAGVLGPSTLHLMWDVLGAFAREGRPILLDQDAYAISHWGVEHAKAIGGRVGTFRHHDLDGLRRQLMSLLPGRAGPVIVIDGICVDCGTVAPLGAFLEMAREYGGVVLCDDTQACGVLGTAPDGARPYGTGGGGTAAWSGTVDDGLVIVASLAKGFGVPVAALSACRARVNRFLDVSQTRVHCSAPSTPVVLAAEHALRVNSLRGDRLRARLCRNVRLFRSALTDTGAPLATSGLFPVQSLGPFDRASAGAMHTALAQQGVLSVMTSTRGGTGSRLTFLLSARHRADELQSAARVVANVSRTAHVKQRGTGS